MSQDFFEVGVITNTIILPLELCDISKKTKQKYLEYFKTHRNKNIQKG
jgi:hypothetical protein